MKYVKTLGLAAVMGAALIAFVGAGTGTASATTLTGEGGAILKAGSEIHAVNVGTVKLTTSFKTIECEEATVKGTTDNETGTTVTATIPKANLTWGKCNCEVNTLAGGKLHITSSGAVSSSGTEVTASCSTIFGNVHCVYSTGAGTGLGTLTGSRSLNNQTARLDFTFNFPRLSTSGLCSETAIWHLEFSIDSPDWLDVSN